MSIFIRIADSPHSAIATGIFPDLGPNGEVVVLIQIEHAVIVSPDIDMIRDLRDGLSALIPIMESGVIPPELKAVDLDEPESKRVTKRVSKNRKHLGLSPQRNG